MPQPGFDGRPTLVESHRLPRLVAKRRHRDGTQVALADRGGNPGEIHLALQQMAQRTAVEQSHRLTLAQTEQAMSDETKRLADHSGPVGTVHLAGAKALPDPGQALDRLAETQGAAGQPDGIDGARRGTDDHRERVLRALRQQFGDGRQHADLIGGTRPAAGQDQAGDGFALSRGCVDFSHDWRPAEVMSHIGWR
ncbi:hypothetical protein D9M71_577160 [compost metagenome]